jgi:hypothetical protein
LPPLVLPLPPPLVPPLVLPPLLPPLVLCVGPQDQEDPHALPLTAQPR